MPTTKLVGRCVLFPDGIVADFPVKTGSGLNVVTMGELNNPLPLTSPCKVNPVFNNVFKYVSACVALLEALVADWFAADADCPACDAELDASDALDDALPADTPAAIAETPAPRSEEHTSETPVT